MSTKDISRFLFQPRKHYVGMRMQQGRVLLDSDHNEGAFQEQEEQRRTLLELIGPQGTPNGGFFIGSSSSDGVNGGGAPVTVGAQLGVTQVQLNGASTPITVPNFYVMPGTMYVGGLRVELEQPEHIAFQSDFLPQTANFLPPSSDDSGTVAYFFYLHVWEQCVTAVEDEELLEHALGGPDTSVRVRRMRRVEVAVANVGEDCHEAFQRAMEDLGGPTARLDFATGELLTDGRLRLGFGTGTSEDTCAPCHPDPTGRYLGAENQTVRIVLADPTHFVWAYDNAAPLYRVTISGIGPTPTKLTVTMLTLPKDVEHWPLEGRVVEVVPWAALLDNGEKVAAEVGAFCKVSRSFDDSKTFEIDISDSAQLIGLTHAWDDDHPRLADLGDGSEPRQFYVRFWHQTGPDTPIRIPIDSTAALGTTGLVPEFTSEGNTGDFWIAALRPETPDRIVPFELQDTVAGVKPHGPRHFFAPLARVDSANNVVTSVEDCRQPMLPVTDKECCTFVVGDGVHSFGQFTSIQAAINALPPSGGRVCIRPGLYQEEISIHDRDDVVLSGCGERTIIQSPPNAAAEALLEIQRARNVNIESLKLRVTGQKGIWLHNMSPAALLDLKLEAVPPPIGSSIPDDAPVVHIEKIGQLLVRGLDIAASRRTGLQIDQVAGGLLDGPVQLFDIALRGIASTTLPPPVGPLVSFQNGRMDLENWHVQAFGQVGLNAVQCTVRGRRLRIISLPFSADAPARSCLNSEFGGLLVEESEFQLAASVIGGVFTLCEHAAVVLFGTVIFQNNSVSGDGGWGGIQIRAGQVTIRGNTITGGAGHGITLGSALWVNSTNASDTRQEGAGKGQLVNGQVTGDIRNGFTEGGVLFLPRPEFPLGDLEIIDNDIQFMRTNGISVLTLLGWPERSPEGLILPAINGPCRILGNRITRNITNPSPSIQVAAPLLPVGGSKFGALAGYNVPLTLLPLGGIVLGGSVATSPAEVAPLDLEIRDNVIEDNNTSLASTSTRTLPTCGIFVLAGNSITISGNRIARNGSTPQPADVLRTGLRAGIAVPLAGAPAGSRAQIEAFLNDGVTHPPSRYALHVIDNHVEQPEGRALFAVGAGPMAVENNFFSSLGFHGSTTSPEAQADIHAIGDVVYVHNLGRPWESFGLPTDASNSGAPPGTFAPPFSLPYLKDRLAEYGSPHNVFFVGLGGQTQFSNNRVVYDWAVQQVSLQSLSLALIALISLDHVACQGNQLAFRLQTGALTLPTPPLPLPPPNSNQGFGGRPVLTHLLAVGSTVEVSGNRVAEGLDDCEASIFSIAFTMNSTMMNMTTHCTEAFNRHDGPLQSANNLSFLQTGDNCTGLQNALFDFADEFINLLYDRRA